MKKICFLLLLGAHSNLFAQPVQNKKIQNWSIGIQMNSPEKIQSFVGYIPETHYFTNKTRDMSFSIGINFGLRLGQNAFFRISTDYNKINIKGLSDSRELVQSPPIPITSYTLTNIQIRQESFFFIPGLGWPLISGSKIDFYCGFNVPLLLRKNLAVERNSAVYDSTNFQISNDDLILTVPGGYAIGLGAFSGFGIKIFQNVSIEAEGNFSIRYNHYGGIYTAVGAGSSGSYTVSNRDEYEKLETSIPRMIIRTSFFF